MHPSQELFYVGLDVDVNSEPAGTLHPSPVDKSIVGSEFRDMESTFKQFIGFYTSQVLAGFTNHPHQKEQPGLVLQQN